MPVTGRRAPVSGGALCVDGERFLLDDKPFRILSGGLHYFRSVSAHWRDRLSKLKAMGLNTVETYVPWSLHEPEPGRYCFAAGLDVERFIDTAEALDLYVILRPGPYVCGELDLGGLPAWLLRDPAIRLRSSDPRFLDAVDRWFDVLLPRLAARQYPDGGPVIAMQMENEYANGGTDRAYLRHLERAMRDRGVGVLLFTADHAPGIRFAEGGLPHLLRTINFGRDAAFHFSRLRLAQPAGPLMCAEFWNGWFDQWGEDHHLREAADAAETLEEILAAGASVNLYMFHGGSNFGFTSGATLADGAYRAVVTSYDCDAPLDEAGEPTPKFHAMRRVLEQFADLPPATEVQATPRLPSATVRLDAALSLWDALDALGGTVHHDAPVTMEALGQAHGFILYGTELAGPLAGAPLSIHGLADRAYVYVNRQLAGILDRECAAEATLRLDVPHDGAALEILVENMGRVNYGPGLADRKGIGGAVVLGGRVLRGWSIRCLPLDSIAGLPLRGFRASTGPAFLRGGFDASDPLDAFLALPEFRKGVAWVNGFNLGRYWERGPQRTLYVPGPLLSPGRNELTVFELRGWTRPLARLQPRAELG